MSTLFTRLSHAGKPTNPSHHEPHTALLIDFDNVTMGIRSDITKELKNLLNSDIIKGKVSVQRAYADWRRYPQYVVPLAETSVDLIFAPAYGSSKKNATDIRLAIDALELVFTRPEIGTFILLSGDSDFSSLVLKLKEYGKYVIGVGIRESASDLLVQNCDEYYSYSALTGLTRAGEEEPAVSTDPWELVDVAVRQMTQAGDVMRSDRLKQVLLELDPNFDEKTLGFSKFNRFVTEAANRGLLRVHKMENGQFEIALAEVGDEVTTPAETARPAARPTRAREAALQADLEPIVERMPGGEPVERTRGEREVRGSRRGRAADRRETQGAAGDLRAAYDLLRRAALELGGSTENAVRDSDVKRRMLDLEPNWDESTLGFSKFSRFLRQAHDAEVINLRKIDGGNYELTLPDGAVPQAVEPVESEQPAARGRGGRRAHEPAAEPMEEPRAKGRGNRRGRRRSTEAAAPPPTVTAPAAGLAAPIGPAPQRPAAVAAPPPSAPPDSGPPRGVAAAARAAPAVGLRRGSRGRSLATPPTLLEGQAIAPSRVKVRSFSPAELGLPIRAEAVIEYLTRAYRGIGRKSAETLTEAVGAGNVFTTLATDPDRVRAILGEHRAAALLQAWQADFERRSGNGATERLDGVHASPVGDGGSDAAVEPPRRSGSRRGRARGRRGGRGRRKAATHTSRDG